MHASKQTKNDRGGKNSYFEGNQRVLTFVGGGYIEKHGRSGIVLDGLFSNVDWAPTLLAFANIVPSDYKQVSFTNDNSDMSISLDGYNMYDYLMSDSSAALRDHIIFTIVSESTDPTVDETSNAKSANEVKMLEQLEKYHLSQLAMIMYDDSGKLWKYFHTEASTNPLGGLTDNSGWCRLASDNDFEETSKYTIEEVTEAADNGIFDLTSDESEEKNLMEGMDAEQLESLQAIVSSKLEYYLNSDMSENSGFISLCYECLFTRYNVLANPKQFGGVWAPFLDKERFDAMIKEECDVLETDLVYQLHTSTFELPDGELIDWLENVNWKMEQLNAKSSIKSAMSKKEESLNVGSQKSGSIYHRNSNDVGFETVGFSILIFGVLCGMSFIILETLKCWLKTKQDSQYVAL